MTEDFGDRTRYLLPPTARLILDTLDHASGPLSLLDIAHDACASIHTTLKITQPLVRHGWVCRTQDGRRSLFQTRGFLAHPLPPYSEDQRKAVILTYFLAAVSDMDRESYDRSKHLDCASVDYRELEQEERPVRARILTAVESHDYVAMWETLPPETRDTITRSNPLPNYEDACWTPNTVRAYIAAAASKFVYADAVGFGLEDLAWSQEVSE